MKPLNDRVLVKRLESEEKTAGGLFIPDAAKEKPSKGEVIACGGIADKNPLFMQIYADVLGRPMLVSASNQTCALGAAMMGMLAAGVYPDVPSAQAGICAFKDRVYRPVPSAKVIYDELYKLYCELHDSFGVAGTSFDHASLMKRLLDLRSN